MPAAAWPQHLARAGRPRVDDHVQRAVVADGDAARRRQRAGRDVEQRLGAGRVDAVDRAVVHPPEHHAPVRPVCRPPLGRSTSPVPADRVLTITYSAPSSPTVMPPGAGSVPAGTSSSVLAPDASTR